MNIIPQLQSAKDYIDKIFDSNNLARQQRKNTFKSILQISVMAIKEYMNGKVAVRASGLTYYTLLSLVPIIALVFAIAKGFGMEELISSFLNDTFAQYPELIQYLETFTTNTLNNAKSSVIAGVGIIMLLYTVFKLLNNIEKEFNHTWHIKKSRPITRKVTDYLSIMVLAPILLLAANSITITMRTVLKQHLIGNLSIIATILLSALPLFIMIATFTLLYLVMPNTKVKFRPALIAGIITGIAFQLVQWVYITFQIGVNNAGAIYGTFAFIPLLLAWMQINWTLILAGNQIAFSIQNISQYAKEQEGKKQISINTEQKIATLIMFHIIKNYVNNSKQNAPTSTNHSALAEQLLIPSAYLESIIEKLKRTNLISEIASDQDDAHLYLPAADINIITINEITNRLNNLQDNNIDLPLSHSPNFLALNNLFSDTKLFGQQNHGNTPLQNLPLS